MELTNICKLNTSEKELFRRIIYILLAGLVVYAWVWLIKRFNLRWYSIMILTPFILLIAWNMFWFAGIPDYYICKLLNTFRGKLKML